MPITIYAKLGVPTLTKAVQRMTDEILTTVLDNPIIAGAIGTALAGVLAFFKPIMRALQTALVRRINQAWVDEADAEDDDIEKRVRRTSRRLLSQTIVPLPKGLVEAHVRKAVSSSEPPPPS